ncbi:BatA domain-containing protein [Allomuricauda sp. CAU 1633]|uniref:BatA domain-containing protein n=1 Tax=Allomuricauda sp. CAU 1633 TaxID=2816036 RepID=UPI001F5C31F5|nr:BatA domain-containing protein [Muricauda sp. CAU 1633]
MQFKHPEILWALALLVIPVLIHLFQLRRYKKTPFTNVAMLQKVVSESRKSNSLKKWLLLLTRLLLMAALIIAFAQPFSSTETALKEKEIVVYLDNSFSMQVKTNGLSLLEKAVQDLIKNIDGETVFSLFTNESTYDNVNIKDIQNILLSLPYSHKQLHLDEVKLKAATLFSKSNSSVKNLILVSDFQQRIASNNTTPDSVMTTYLVPIQPREAQNIAIDSIYLADELSEQPKLTALLSGGSEEQNLPISLFNNDTLIAKSAAKFDSNGAAEVVFSIPGNTKINGRLSITENGLSYDNRFYFNINEREKIKVLAISASENNYLERLYPDTEFDFQKVPLNQLNYSDLDEQNVVVLDNLQSIPSSLQNVLRTFKDNGGTLIVVPSNESDVTSYNSFLSSFSGQQLGEKVANNTKVTSISFNHPLYKNVFEKEVTNFQYPTVKEYYKVQSRMSKILALEGNDVFLLGNDGFYMFTASLETDNSNFKNSPLIVPTFYNMATTSLQMPEIYHILGEISTVDISTNLGSDDILNVSKTDYDFIPLQQTFPNRVRLTFDQNPTSDGIYSINQEGQLLQNISFNHPRTESKLNYLEVESIPNTNTQDSIASLFEYLEAESNITAYWKWFVILALLLVLTEVLIQKFIT